MNISVRPLLQQPDPSESAERGVLKDGVNPGTINSNVSSTTESMGASAPSRANVNIVLRATIPAGHIEGKAYLTTQKIESIYRDGDHFVLLASTPTGELLKLEVFPGHVFVSMG